MPWTSTEEGIMQRPMFLVMLLPKGLLRCAVRLARGPWPVACAATMNPAETRSALQDICSYLKYSKGIHISSRI